MDGILGILSAILLLVPILFLLVLTHEYGHFLTARLFGVTVHEFGIGFPPKARTLFVSKKTGVEYTLNWLPIGGFVRMEGEDGESKDPNAFIHKPAWQRLIILASGSFVNLVTAVLIFSGLALFTGTNIPQTQVGIYAVEAGSPAEVAGLKGGDVLVKVNNANIRSADELRFETELNIGVGIPLVINRAGQQVNLTVVPRKSDAKAGKGALGIETIALYDSLIVNGLTADSAAAKAGLRNDDEIVAVDGTRVTGAAEPDSLALANAIKGKQSVTLTVLRGGKETTVAGVPVKLQPRLDGNGNYSLARLEDTPFRTPLQHVSYGLFESVGAGFNRVGTVFGQMGATFKALFQGSQPVTALSGPVGIGALTNQVAQNGGILGLLSLMGFLGVNLFVVNMLPIPALDGGRFLFVLIELLLRPFGVRRIPPRLEGTVHFVGFAVLMLFILVITVSDIGRLFGGS